MKIELLRASEWTPELDLDCERWRATGAPELRTGFVSPSFFHAVAAARSDTWVARIETDGHASGLFAFHRRAGRIGVPLGAHLSDYQGIISAAPLGLDAPTFLRGCRLELFDFDHLIPNQIQDLGSGFRRAESPIMETSRGYEALCVELRRRSTSWTKCRQSRKRMEREVGPLRFELDCRDRHVWDSLWKWKRGQYAATGVRDCVGPAWVRELLERLWESRTVGEGGICSALWAGERLVAAHFGLVGRGVWHYWFPAYDPAWARYGPGLLLLDELARSAAERGVAHIDLGKGMQPYKLAWSTNSIQVLEGTASVGGVVTAYRRAAKGFRSIVRQSPVGPLLRRLRDQLR